MIALFGGGRSDHNQPGRRRRDAAFQLGELWPYGSYTTSQALSASRVVWNAEAVDTLNAFSATSSTISVPAGAGSARVSARVRHDGLGGSAAGTVFARIQRSTNSGSTWDSISEGTASHPGGTPDQTIDVPETTITTSPGHQFRVLCGPSGVFGQVSHQNNPDRTFLRFEWGP